MQTAIRETIRDLSKHGIPAFVDKRGHHWSPERYVRMDLRTTLGNTANAAQWSRCDQFGISLISVDSHSGSRPLCAPYQGRIFSRDGTFGVTSDGSGKRIEYSPLNSTSYGQPAGLFGINCGHSSYPFIPGINIQRYFPVDPEENAARYKELQKQRQLEREIRAGKRECMMLQAAGDEEGYKKAALRLRTKREQYRIYSNTHNFSLHNDRTQVYGFDRSKSMKTVWAEKKVVESEKRKKIGNDNSVNFSVVNSAEYRKKFDGITDDPEINDLLCKKARDILNHRNNTYYEDMYLIDTASKKVVGAQTHSKTIQEITYNKSLFQAVKKYPPKSLISIHNHPESKPPSGSDFSSCGHRKYLKGIVCCHNGTIFTYQVGNKPFNAYLFDKTVDKYKKMYYNMSEEDAYIATLKQFEKDYGIKWEKK